MHAHENGLSPSK